MFLDNHVPEEVKAGLLQLNEEQCRALAIFPDVGFVLPNLFLTSQSDVSSFPPSLCDFLTSVRSLAMPSHLPRADAVAGSADAGTIQERLVTLEGAFTQGMKEKKQHEVQRPFDILTRRCLNWRLLLKL